MLSPCITDWCLCQAAIAGQREAGATLSVPWPRKLGCFHGRLFAKLLHQVAARCEVCAAVVGPLPLLEMHLQRIEWVVGYMQAYARMRR